MTSVHGSLLISVLLLFSTSACGSGTETRNEAANRDDVIMEYGRALLTTDYDSMAALLEPDVRDAWISTPEFTQLKEIPVPDNIELRNLSFSVVSDQGSTIDVIYEGERCAPSVTNEFSSTTVVSSDNSGDAVVNEGSVVFGEVVCSAIAPGFEPPFSPVRFIEVEGEWYATLES